MHEPPFKSLSLDTDRLGEDAIIEHRPLERLVGHLSSLPEGIVASDQPNEFLNCRYWTERAFLQWSGKREFANLSVTCLVPPELLAAHMMTIPSPTPGAIQELLRLWARECVVNVSEFRLLEKYTANRMPEGWGGPEGSWAGRDIWARFRRAFRRLGVVVHRIDWINGEPAESRPIVLRIPPLSGI
jgi:hypothetical protein